MLEKIFSFRKKKEQKPQVLGYIGNITSNRVSGWAYLRNIKKPAEATLYINGELIEQTTAELYRKDLKENGQHLTGQCGYVFVLDKEYDVEYLKNNVKVVVEEVELQRSAISFLNLESDNLGDIKDHYFFIHIPKTAGTSFRKMLYEHFPQSCVFPNHADIRRNSGRYPTIDALAEKSKEKQAKIRLLAGHYTHNTSKVFPNDCKKMLFLREPYERAISNLFHLKKFGENFKNSSYEEVFEKSFTNLDNLQVRYLSNAIRKQKLDRADLELAKENLRNCHLVGITEKFNESIEIAEKLFDWDFSKNRIDNVNKGKDVSVLSADVLHKLKIHNELDQELYAYGLELFEECYRNPFVYITKMEERLQAKATPVAPVVTPTPTITPVNAPATSASTNSNIANTEKKATQPAKPKPPVPDFLKGVVEATEQTNSFIGKVNDSKVALVKQPIKVGGKELKLQGWAIDKPKNQLASDVYICKNDKEYFKVNYGLPRKDIIKHFENEGFLNSGFQVKIPIENWEEGKFNMHLLVVAHDKKSFYRNTKNVQVEYDKSHIEPVEPVKEVAKAPKTSKTSKADKVNKAKADKVGVGKGAGVKETKQGNAKNNKNQAKGKRQKEQGQKANKQRPSDGRAKGDFSKPAFLDATTHNTEKTEHNLANINGKKIAGLPQPIAIKQNKIIFKGWGIDITNQLPASDIYIVVDGQKYFRTSYGQERKQVLKKFKNKALLKSGFQTSFPTNILGKGYHSVGVLIVSNDRKSYYTSSSRIVIDIP